MFSNELKNFNKNEKMTINFIHISEKNVDEFLNIMKTVKTAFHQFKHQYDISSVKDTQAQNCSITLIF